MFVFFLFLSVFWQLLTPQTDVALEFTLDLFSEDFD